MYPPTVLGKGNPAHPHSGRRLLHPVHCLSAGHSTHACRPRCLSNKSALGQRIQGVPCLRAVHAGLQESSAAPKQGLHARSVSRSAEHMTNGSSAPVDDTDRTPTWSARTDVLATTKSLNVAGVQTPGAQGNQTANRPCARVLKGMLKGFCAEHSVSSTNSTGPCCFRATRERCQTTQTGGMRPRWP